MWYDRPCIENDATDEPGHKFMCECNVPDKQTGVENPNPQNCQDNNEEIDIASIGERNTVICQNPRPTNNPTKNANIGTPTGTTQISRSCSDLRRTGLLYKVLLAIFGAKLKIL